MIDQLVLERGFKIIEDPVNEPRRGYSEVKEDFHKFTTKVSDVVNAIDVSNDIINVSYPDKDTAVIVFR